MKSRDFYIAFIANPFYLYIISIIVSLLVYNLEWSDFYSRWNKGFILFLLGTIFTSLIFAHLPIIGKCNRFHKIHINRNNKLWLCFIIIAFVIEFIYCRQIPLLWVLIGGIGNYKDFTGIQGFHPLLMMITNFWGIYWYIQYLSNPQEKKLRTYAYITFIPYLLMLNRGGTIILILSYLFVYIIYKQGFRHKHLFVGFIFFIFFIIGFGFIGNSRDSRYKNENEFILDMGKAKENFRDTGLPDSFFWFYLYVASPFGNMQYAMDQTSPDITFEGLIDSGIQNGTPDFISKRMQFLLSNPNINVDNYLVSINLNAPSVYFYPYLRAGYIGMWAMYFFIVLLTLMYSYVLPKSSPYFLVGWVANLSCIVLCTFNNMWAAGGLQVIILPIFFDVANKLIRKWKVLLYQ